VCFFCKPPSYLLNDHSFSQINQGETIRFLPVSNLTSKNK
jgi:hypothetical protein